MPIGAYTVEVTATGFKKFVQKGIALDVNVNARVDASLDIGAMTEEIDVTASAPLVNTDNAQIGRTVENSEITTLPIVGRNVYTLLNLIPGVSSTSNSIVLGYPEQRTMINGGVDGGAGSVNYYLDGGTNMTGLRNTGNIAPNPDAVEEFRVVTNSYSAEYGRFAGGVINIITRSGGNDFHGSLFEFFRNNDLNAYPWLSLTTSPLHRNQFGGAFGGPIRKNKTFFFGTYSGLRQITKLFPQFGCGAHGPGAHRQFLAIQDRAQRSQQQQRAVPGRHHPHHPPGSRRDEHPQQVPSGGQSAEQLLAGNHSQSVRHR